MKLNWPSVGPIVGATGPYEARVFIRAGEEVLGKDQRRCFGALRWRGVGDAVWSLPIFNKLSPIFDFSCVFVLQNLVPETPYEYQVGWFFADAELDHVQALASDLQWPAPEPDFELSFTTGPAANSAPRRYIVGSCRYVLRLFGGNFFDDRGDKTFRSVLEQIAGGQSVDALLMIGDQIYADDLKGVAPDRTMDQFLERYRAVFAQEYIRKLMARVPTYMILDDHEIEDNWPAGATGSERASKYVCAMHAYQIYQCSHGPLFKSDGDRIEGTLSHFWYSFRDGCADWFVMDSRTERVLEPGDRRMVSDKQLKALLEWLDDGSGNVKFIVTSVPMFPDMKSDKNDKWDAFPEQRQQILDFIHSKRIRKVVFVSGDVHCSFTSELRLEGDDDFLVHQIVSSSFFWPLPHMRQSSFGFGEALKGKGNQRYVGALTSEMHSKDNFARIEVDQTSVVVSFYERKGDALGSVTLVF